MQNKLLIALTLTVGLMLSSCQQAGNTANSNKTTNSATVTNSSSTANSNAGNSTTTATNNANASSSDANKSGDKDLTAKPADGEKGDCTVKADANLYVEATDKDVKLKKGTRVQYVMFGNQGIAVVKAEIDGKWVRGEIQHDALDCPDDGKTGPVKK